MLEPIMGERLFRHIGQGIDVQHDDNLAAKSEPFVLFPPARWFYVSCFGLLTSTNFHYAPRKKGIQICTDL